MIIPVKGSMRTICPTCNGSGFHIGLSCRTCMGTGRLNYKKDTKLARPRKLKYYCPDCGERVKGKDRRCNSCAKKLDHRKGLYNGNFVRKM
jgi:hypothetical protein